MTRNGYNKHFLKVLLLVLWVFVCSCGPGLSPYNQDKIPPVAGAFRATTVEHRSQFILSWSAASDETSPSENLEYYVCRGTSLEQVSTISNCLNSTTVLDWTKNTLALSQTGDEGNTYYFNVIVRDESGNESLYEGLSQTVSDATPPTNLSFGTTSSVDYTSFTLNWNAATDNISQQAKLLYFVCSGSSIAAIDTVTKCESSTVVMSYTANTTTLSISGKTHSTTYYYNVVVKDEMGNKAVYPGTSVSTIKAFVTSWDTSKAGTSGATQITLPLENGGSYAFTVDWGDNTQDTITAWNDAAKTHTFASSGTYSVAIMGTIVGFRFNGGGDTLKLLNISQWGPLRLGNNSGYFKGAANLTITATDILNLSGTTSLIAAFHSCSSITTVPSMNDWNVSEVTSMALMFRDATLFNQNIGAWNVGSVTNMINMFRGATTFNQDIGSWNVSFVNDMSVMFYGATAFNKNIGAWNVSRVSGMINMFNGATAFNQDIGSWNVGNVTDMTSMFSGATAFNQDISSWNVGNVTGMSSMFTGATAFNQDIGSWDVANVTSMTNMFQGAALSNANYDALLLGWSALTLQNGVRFHAGTAKYTAGGAEEAARNTLTNAPNSWIITDGGPAP